LDIAERLHEVKLGPVGEASAAGRDSVVFAAGGIFFDLIVPTSSNSASP
jgi:hypothetical protein